MIRQLDNTEPEFCIFSDIFARVASNFPKSAIKGTNMSSKSVCCIEYAKNVAKKFS